MLKCFHIDLKWALEHNDDEKQKLNMNDDDSETLVELNGDESSDERLAELNINDHKNKPPEKLHNFDELNVNNDDEKQKLNMNGDESSDETFAELNINDHKNKPPEKLHNFDELNVNNDDEKQKLNMNDDGAETLVELNGDESSDETLAELNINYHKNKLPEKLHNFDELNVNNDDETLVELNGDESSASDESLEAEEQYDEGFLSDTDMDVTYKPDQDSDESESDVSVVYNRKKHVKVINSCSDAEQSEVADSCSEEEGTININDSPVLNQQSISRVSYMVDDSEEDSEEFEGLNEEEILRDSKNPKIYIRRVLKSRIAKHGKLKKHNRVYNSYQYCAPCKIKVSNFAQHLSRNSNKHHAHASVPEITALREEENEALKKKLQSLLRGKFNHAFNMKTIKKGRGEILLERRPVTDFQLKNYGPCPNCFFWYAKKLLKKHQKKCISESDVSQSIGDLTTRSECLSEQLRPIASKKLVKEVFSKMILDEVSHVVKGDTLIIQLGNQWLEKNVGNILKRGVYTSQIVRLVGRFLLNLRKIKPIPGNSEPPIWEYLKPQYFDSIVEACILTASPFLDDEEQLKSPSNAIKLGYDIKRLLNGKIGLAIMASDTSSQEDATRVLKLMEIYWGTKVTKTARVMLEVRSFYAGKNLPSPEDIKRLNTHLRESITGLDYQKTDNVNFRRVAELSKPN